MQAHLRPTGWWPWRPSFGAAWAWWPKRYSSWTVLFYSMGFAALFLVPLLALPEASLGPYSWEVWGWLLFVAAGPTLLARVLYVSAVKHVEASRAAIVANVEPVTAAVFAFFLLGELLMSSQLLGGVLVLAGAVIAQTPNRRS
ncbi:MAG TPA: DMT family transporter [Chloroflexota bacterium]|nr:DMT family transporter [Chloroflexota bacterium]